MDDFDEKFVRAEAGLSDYVVHVAENVALLVDCSEAMQKTPYSGPIVGYKGLTVFEVALCQVQDIVASRVAFGMEAELAIILYNTPSTTRGLDGVRIYYPASPPSMELLERLYYEPPVPCELDHIRHFRNAVAAGILEFHHGKNTPATQTSIIAWTYPNSSHICNEDDATLAEIRELIEKRDLLLHVVSLHDGSINDIDLDETFWSAIIHHTNVRRRYESTWNILPNPYDTTGLPGCLISHTNMFELNRFKGKMKHNSFTFPLHLKSFGVVEMKCSSLTAAAWPKCIGQTVWLDCRDSSMLIGRVFEEIPEDTTPHIVRKIQAVEEEDPYYPKQLSKKEPNAPRIYLPKEDIAHLRFPIATKCAFLVGFKPRSWLQDSWQMREAYFIRPDDQAALIERQKCAALHKAMVEREVVGVCGFIKSDQSEPRLAAILPLSTRTSHDQSNMPLGFSMVELPFADDIRHPEDQSGVLEPSIVSTKGGIALAVDVIKKHPASPVHYPGVAANPQIRWHFSVLHNLIFDDKEQQEDNCLPVEDDFLHTSLLESLIAFKNHHSLK